MATFILYGSKLSLVEAKTILEKLLSVQFQARESDYQGGGYFRFGDRARENFDLKKNMDPFDGSPVEARFSNFPTLLYINATSRGKGLKEIMEHTCGNFILLRYEDF